MILGLVEMEARGKEVMYRYKIDCISGFILYMDIMYRYINPYLKIFLNLRYLETSQRQGRVYYKGITT